MPFFQYDHPSVRLTGRWGAEGAFATATATGAYIEIAFCGEQALLKFDTHENEAPMPHLWLELDGGAKIETALDAYLRIDAKTDGEHLCRIIYKGGPESHARWYAPRSGKISFCGYTALGAGTLPEEVRKTIEFVGDSITEGVLTDADYDTVPRYPDDLSNRAFQDDVCATYAWLLAERFDLRPLFMGYGAVGATKGGNGGVPRASEAYPFCFDGAPVPYGEPDYILINHGANDRDRTEEAYLAGYRDLLDTVTAAHRGATVICLSAFCGVHGAALGRFVGEYSRETGKAIRFVDSAGWVPEEPLHPLRDGHETIAAHLAAELADVLGA